MNLSFNACAWSQPANADLLPTPADMVRYMDRFIRGQTQAKRDLATAIYNHYLSEASVAMGGDELGTYHLLLLGPTGSGKSYMVRVLADFLGVRMASVSATSLVEAGYKGDNVESIVRTLLDRAGGDPRVAERGVIFIDEIDKIKSQESGGTRDVSGTGVQNALLGLLDGRLSSGMEGQTHATVDTRRIQFICAGAFVGLDEVVRDRLNRRGQLGFGQSPESTSATRVAGEVGTEDLVRFGMIPEFIGRFSSIARLQPLTRDDLLAILTETQGSALQKQIGLAAAHGITLQFAGDALDVIADEAHALGTGARGLHRLLCRTLDDVAHRWVELAEEGITTVEIGRDCVLRQGPPVLKRQMRTQPRRDETLRRAAATGIPRTAMATRVASVSGGLPPGITDVRGLSEADIRERIDAGRLALDWENTTGAARKWWEDFESENQHRPALVLRLVEELLQRKATITEFFLSYVHSNTDNIQANLHFLDYARLKNTETDTRRAAHADSASPSAVAADEDEDEDEDDDRALQELEKLLESMKETEPEETPAKKSARAKELTFVRCPTCHTLIPARSKLCRACGTRRS